ncbi:hypothetical protein Cus16_1643 [Curtobacterium sp. ER1/6]|nr:hypothetical protein Cus16_1643 [Curtobacterium sp. ER1/6]
MDDVPLARLHPQLGLEGLVRVDLGGLLVGVVGIEGLVGGERLVRVGGGGVLELGLLLVLDRLDGGLGLVGGVDLERVVHDGVGLGVAGLGQGRQGLVDRGVDRAVVGLVAQTEGVVVLVLDGDRTLLDGLDRTGLCGLDVTFLVLLDLGGLLGSRGEVDVVAGVVRHCGSFRSVVRIGWSAGAVRVGRRLGGDRTPVGIRSGQPPSGRPPSGRPPSGQTVGPLPKT